MALSIENIDEQFIILGTKNYELAIDIGGNPDTVDATGHMEGFNSHWDAALQRLYIRADEVTRLIGGVQWDITLVKGSEQLQREIKYNVIPPGVIFHDLALIHLYRDVPINFDVIIENIPPLIIPTARLLGLKSELLEHGLTVQGRIPSGSVFASDKGNTEIIVPLETGGALKREYPYMIEVGNPPSMNTPTFTPHGDYGLLDFDPVTHALEYEWTLGEVNADTVWNDTRPVVDPSQIEVTPGNLEVSLKFPNVPMASSYEYRLDSESHTREWTRFEGVLDNGFIGVVIPDLQEGVEYTLSIRVGAPWIGSPVSIKFRAGWIMHLLNYISRGSVILSFSTAVENGGAASLVKRFNLPTEINNPTGLVVQGDTAYVTNESNDTIYVLDISGETNTTPRIIRRFLVPTQTTLPGKLAIKDDLLYLTNRVSTSFDNVYTLDAQTANNARARLLNEFDLDRESWFSGGTPAPGVAIHDDQLIFQGALIGSLTTGFISFYPREPLSYSGMEATKEWAIRNLGNSGANNSRGCELTENSVYLCSNTTIYRVPTDYIGGIGNRINPATATEDVLITFVPPAGVRDIRDISISE